MSESRTVTERDAIRAVERYVEHDWMSRWQEFDARNDDGIDGIVMLRKKQLDKKKTKTNGPPHYKSHPIRGVLFVQVKGGESYAGESKKRPDHIEIKLVEEYIQSHRPRWNALAGPAILVYVDTVNLKQNLDAWWTDLKDDANYTTDNKQIVLVAKSNKFGPHSKGHMRELIGPATQYDEQLPVVIATKEDSSYVHLKQPLKDSARRFYRGWSASPTTERSNPMLGEVLITRVGWRHITRSGRRQERIIQSMQLLGVAKRIIKEVGSIGWLGRMEDRPLKNGTTQRRELLGIRAKVKFPFRHESVIQVILERKRIYGQNLISEKIWFYSVYEARRGE
ncbi:MAG TPA: hypothetical protein DIW81_20360 [Planctomycetaceae bacterium]|nr:hypothetical protein [Planctomycetaceae bacterium]